MLKLKIETYLILDETTLEISKVKNRYEIVDTRTGLTTPITFSTIIWGMLKSILSSASGDDLPTSIQLSQNAKKKLRTFLNQVNKN